MKKFTAYLIAIAIACYLPSYADDLDEVQDDYEQAIGVCAADGMSTGVGVSMMGWGIAIIVGITILAIVIHQSAGGTTHSTTATGGTGGSSSTGSGSGIGSVI